MAPEPVLQKQGFGVWPENWDAFQLFTRLLQQWTPAPAGGVLGLNYGSLPLWLDALGVKPERRLHVLDGLQVMERAAAKRINVKVH